MVIAERYNTLEKDYTTYMTEVLIMNKPCHIVCKFKDFMIFDFIDEFLKR